MSEEFPRKKMNLLGPMGLSIIAHGLIVAGVGYVGLQSVNKGESVSEMEFGADQGAALQQAPENSVTPMEVATTPAPQPVLPPAPEVRPAPVAPELSPTPPPEKVQSSVIVPPTPKVIPPPPEPAPEKIPEPAVAATQPPAAEPSFPEPVPPQPAEPQQATPQSAEEIPPALPMKAQRQESIDADGTNDPQSTDGDGAENETAAAQSPGLPEGVISDSQLSPLQMARPDYPMQEKMKGHQGDVVLLYSLKGDGSVGNIRIFKSSGFKNLDMSAARALSQYKYPSGRTAEVIKTFSFRLKGPSVESPSRWRK